MRLKGKTFIQVLSVLCLLAFASTFIGCGTMAGAGLGAAIGAAAGNPALGAIIGAGVGAFVDAAWVASELSAQQQMMVCTPPSVVIYGPFYDLRRNQVWGKDQWGRIWVWNRHWNHWYLL